MGWASLVIGLAVASAILVFAPLTGASLNPERTFGPHTVQTLFDGEVDRSQMNMTREPKTSRILCSHCRKSWHERDHYRFLC